MRRFTTILMTPMVLCLGLGLSLWGQSVSQISGTVKDISGSAVPGAEVTVTQTDTGVTRTAQSDANGVYSLPSLPLGPYRMEVKKDGFTTYLQSGIVLLVDTAPTIDPVLTVGAVSESVQVEASAAMVESHSTGVGQVVNEQQVIDLPLNGREVTQLITLAGASNTVQYAFGQAPASGNLMSSKNYPNEALVSVAGGMLTGTTYLMDGGTHNDPFNNLNLPLPFPDAVQEFKVETSALPAEYGQHSAGAVNIVTMSGTNAFHGDAFEFVRNGYFNARDTFAPKNDNLKRNQFGGTLGGPIKKNKLFFFLGYQGTLIRSAPAATPAVVPTPSMLAGDFRAYESQCFRGGPQNLGAPFVNNVLPRSLISPQALAMASHFPAGPEPCGNTTYTMIANQDEHMGLAKLDYQISSKQSFFARYFGTHSLQPSSFTGTELSIQNAGTDDEVNSLVLGHTYIFSPNALNTFHATLDRDGITKFQVPIISPTTIGVQGVYVALPNFSNININGDFVSAGGFATPGLVNTTTYQFSDDFTLIKGSHQMQFGANYIRPMQATTFCVYCNGLFSFTGQDTGTGQVVNGVKYSGNPMADFVAGQLDSFTQLNISHDNEKWNYIGLYAQDNWKVNSRLTLNYGVRWEPYLNGRIVNDRVSHFNMQDFLANVHSNVYPNAPAGTLYPGDPGFQTGGRPNNTTWNNFAPRVGLAWDPEGDGKTLIRASFGILYDMPQTLFYYNYATEPLWGESITVINPPGGFANPWQGYPGGSPFPTTQNRNTPYPTAGYYETVPLNVQNTYVEQWNLTLQKQVGPSWLLKASYLGNETAHLWTDQELNPAIYVPGNCVAGQYGLKAPGPCSTLSNTQPRRLLTQLNPTQGPYYGQLEYLDDGGTASYNALIVSAEHRLSSHFSMLANYTYSHCIGDLVTTELSGPIYTDPSNRRFDRGNCTAVDVRHNFNLSAILQAPHFASRPLQWIAGDWQLAPIVGLHSGSFFAVTTGVDNALNGIGGQRPNQILADPYCTVQTIHCWLNPKAFANPATGTLGSSGQNSLVGPGYFDVDFALIRQFPVKEHQYAEIRVEAFNIQNRANFLNPSTPGLVGGASGSALNSALFGQILSDVSPRIMQFAARYVF